MTKFVIIFFLLSEPAFIVDFKLAGGPTPTVCNRRIEAVKEWFRAANDRPPIFGMRCEPNRGGAR